MLNNLVLLKKLKQSAIGKSTVSAATVTSTIHQDLASGFIETDNAQGKLNTTNHKCALELHPTSNYV